MKYPKQFTHEPRLIISEVEGYKEHLENFLVNGEAEIIFKELSPQCLVKLANHYEPMVDSDEVINEPSEVAPYQRFTKRINKQLVVEFRGPKLEKTTTYKEILS